MSTSLAHKRGSLLIDTTDSCYYKCTTHNAKEYSKHVISNVTSNRSCLLSCMWSAN